MNPDTTKDTDPLGGFIRRRDIREDQKRRKKADREAEDNVLVNLHGDLTEMFNERNARAIIESPNFVVRNAKIKRDDALWLVRKASSLIKGIPKATKKQDDRKLSLNLEFLQTLPKEHKILCVAARLLYLAEQCPNLTITPRLMSPDVKNLLQKVPLDNSSLESVLKRDI